MAYSRIIHTKSEVVGAVPADSSISYGEIAINYSDGHLYIKKEDNTVHKVASSDFPGQISNLERDVTSLTSTVNLLNLQFTAADDLIFGRENVNAIRSNNSLTFGLANELGTAASNSQAFGIGNKVSSENGIAVGAFNEAAGSNSISIGSRVKTPADVFELGKWSSTSSRTSSVRIASGNVAMTLNNSSTAIKDGGSVVGEELDDKLPHEMYAIRRNGDEILIDVNIAGEVKTCSLGDSSSNPGSSVKSIGETDPTKFSGEVAVKAIRKLTQQQYTDLGSDRDAATLYIVT